MLGKNSPHIQAVRPLIDGVISNLTLTQEMIKHFFSKIFSRTIGHPRIMMCVPSSVTDVEQRAVIEAARDVGAKIFTLSKNLLRQHSVQGLIFHVRTVLWLLDDRRRHNRHCSISLGGIVVSRSLKIAGDEFNEAIIRYMRKKKWV